MSLSDLTWGPPTTAAPIATVVADLVALTKPRIVSLLVLTGVAATVVAAGGWPDMAALAAVSIGGGMAGAGAGSINCALEGDLDRKMARTSQRPVAAGRLSARFALIQGIVLNLVAFLLITTLTNPLAAALTLAGTLWYVFVYTLWLKPRTAINIVVGGLAGSFPPLVGWAAVTGRITTTALALAAVIFFWTPSHFWALATLAHDDYRTAGIPMLPTVAGTRRAARGMLAYAAVTLVVSIVPVFAGDLRLPYLAAALGTGGWFIGLCCKHLRRLTPTTARRAFMGSLAYLAAIFLAAMLDVVLR